MKLFERKFQRPNSIFTSIKSSKHEENHESLNDYYNNCGIMAQEFAKTGQLKALKHLQYLMECVEKEKKVVDLGINQFIYRDDILEFLERRDVKDSNIKIIELEDYTRQIPKEVTKKINASKGIFDYFYVLFTDYSNTIARQRQREKKQYEKDNDPILFGTFQKQVEVQQGVRKITERDINDKFYVIGDWIDGYCDLTLDKFIKMTSKDSVKNINQAPMSMEEIKEKINEMETSKKKEGFF